MSWPALDAKLLADSAATFNFRLGLPTPLAITKDGAVLFRRTPPRAFAADLYELAPDGTIKTLATVADLMGSGATRGRIPVKLDRDKAQVQRTHRLTDTRRVG